MSKSEGDTPTPSRFLNPKLLYSLALVTVLINVIGFFTFSTYSNKDDKEYAKQFRSNYQIYSLTIPEKLEFAGEDVPLDQFDIRERLDRELLVNTYWQSQTLLFIKRSNRWFPVIEPILKEQGIPEDFKYLCVIESGLTNSVSSAGATGYWQLLKSTGSENGLEVNSQIDERYHVEKATLAACNYFKSAYEKFGSWTDAAASYNMGKAGFQKQRDRQKADSYYDLTLNNETARYVFRILAMKLILRNPDTYGFNVRKKDLYPELETYDVTLSGPVPDMADYAASYGINYKTLKYYNPWIRDNHLDNKKGKTYTVKMPKGAKLVAQPDSTAAPDKSN